MKTAFVALCLASVALAQSTSSSIPSGIAATCTTFLTQHNNNRVINNCLTSLISSTSAFDTETGTANATAVNAALSTLCSASFNSCPAADIRSALTSFYASCSTDLLGTNGDGSNGNREVIAIYDNLYLILPLKDAICAKAGGQYCINSLPSGSSSTPASQGASGSSTPQGESASQTPQGDSASASASASASPSASASSSSSASASASSASASASAPAKRHARLEPSSLFKRSAHDSHLVARQATNSTNQQTVNAPNADVYRESGLPYLFIQANSTNLCSECTTQVIGAYIRFETVTPYAIGIANSPMLRGQVQLWEQIKQCPNGFAQSLLDSATSSTGGSGSTNGAGKAVAGVGSALVAVFAAVGAAMLF